MKPAIIYARYSPRPAKKGEVMSIETQLDLCRAWCKAHGLDINGEYRDARKSGKSTNDRPGLLSALDHVCRLRGVLVVLTLSRLARSIADAISVADQLRKCRADLAIIKMNIDTSTPTGRMLFHIMAAFAEFEREVTAERTRDVLLNMQDKGMRISRRPRYGFKLDPKDPKHTIRDADEQAIIRIIVQRRRAGMKYRQIAEWLMNNDYPPRNREWHHSTIKDICDRNG